MSKMNERVLGPGNDMELSQQQDVESLFYEAVQMFDNENKIAQYIADAFNDKYYPGWNCIVGKKFGASIAYMECTHFAKTIGPFLIMIWHM